MTNANADYEDVYRRAVALTAEHKVPNAAEKRRRKHEVHLGYINDVFQSIVDKVCAVDAAPIILEAAKQGLDVVDVCRIPGPIGWHELRDEDYACKPLPAAFLALGPKKHPKHKHHGIDYFTKHGVEPLQQRLLLHFSPFRVEVLSVKQDLCVSVHWANGPTHTTNAAHDRESIASNDSIEIVCTSV
jgi:hypothetical protein